MSKRKSRRDAKYAWGVREKEVLPLKAYTQAGKGKRPGKTNRREMLCRELRSRFGL